jgi:ribosome-associated toxin RatA of RatAB toxin-antitoxin module
VKPVNVSTVVARPREEVFEFLEVLANHEGFMDHLFTDWSFSGPARGVGAKARARVNAPSSREFAEFEVVEAQAPERIVEEAVSSNGKRRTRGTYRFESLSEGGTKISFELAWLATPRSERLAPPIARTFIRRANAKAMRRLAKQLDGG